MQKLLRGGGGTVNCDHPEAVETRKTNRPEHALRPVRLWHVIGLEVEAKAELHAAEGEVAEPVAVEAEAGVAEAIAETVGVEAG